MEEQLLYTNHQLYKLTNEYLETALKYKLTAKNVILLLKYCFDESVNFVEKSNVQVNERKQLTKFIITDLVNNFVKDAFISNTIDLNEKFKITCILEELNVLLDCFLPSMSRKTKRKCWFKSICCL